MMWLRARAAGVVVALAIVGSAALTPAAVAGTNGQHVEVIPARNAMNVTICGDNQANVWTCRYRRTVRARVWFTSWWKGWVEITEFAPDLFNPMTPPTVRGVCWVPTSQQSNWVKCRAAQRTPHVAIL
jgi:hypothetical protein